MILWALLLFENGYFDASFILGKWYIWILTQFHPFSSILCSFPPLVTRLISPHHGDPEKAGVMLPFRPTLGPLAIILAIILVTGIWVIRQGGP